MTRYLVLITALALAGCVSAPPQQSASTAPATSPVSLSSDQEARVKQVVTASLKDPDSARFGPMQATYSLQTGTTICGMINARNSFGGYTGDKPYLVVISDSGEAALAALGGVERDTAVALRACQRLGMAL